MLFIYEQHIIYFTEVNKNCKKIYQIVCAVVNIEYNVGLLKLINIIFMQPLQNLT